MGKKFIFVIGSQFEKELENENYSVKILNQIQIKEKNKSLQNKYFYLLFN